MYKAQLKQKISSNYENFNCNCNWPAIKKLFRQWVLVFVEDTVLYALKRVWLQIIHYFDKKWQFIVSPEYLYFLGLSRLSGFGWKLKIYHGNNQIISALLNYMYIVMEPQREILNLEHRKTMQCVRKVSNEKQEATLLKHLHKII